MFDVAIIAMITILILAVMGFFLINKHLNQRQIELDRNYQVSIDASDDALTAAAVKLHKEFDDRLNKTWETIAAIKTDYESLKLAIGISRPNK